MNKRKTLSTTLKMVGWGISSRQEGTNAGRQFNVVGSKQPKAILEVANTQANKDLDILADLYILKSYSRIH